MPPLSSSWLQARRKWTPAGRSSVYPLQKRQYAAAALGRPHPRSWITSLSPFKSLIKLLKSNSAMSIIRSGSYLVRKSEIDQWASTSRVARSSGIKCVAVQGNHAMSVVTCDKDPDLNGMRRCLEFKLLEYISDQLNALKRNSSEDMYPLGVVHVPLGPINVVEKSNPPAVEQNEKDAIGFLESRIKEISTFTLDDTIQLAIRALQLLHVEKFTAEDIQVCYIEQSNLNKIKSLSASEIWEHLEKIKVAQ